MYVESITLLTKEYNEYTVITPKVLDIVKKWSSEWNRYGSYKATTTGVTVNGSIRMSGK